MALLDLTSLGVTFGYGVSASGDTKPTSFTQLHRCSSIGSVGLDQEDIDTSALEDYVTQYSAGRMDTGGSWEVVFNVNEDVLTKLSEMQKASNSAKESGKATWFEIIVPGLTKAFFVIADPGTEIPMPEFGQNEKLEVTLSMTLRRYVGMDTKVAFTTEEAA